MFDKFAQIFLESETLQMSFIRKTTAKKCGHVDFFLF